MSPVSDWIKGYMKYTENSEPPRLFREWCAVSVIAAALQRKCWLEWGTVMMYPNLYVVLTAPAGKARKGTAMKPAQKFLNFLGIPMSAEAVTREALIQLIRTSETQIPEIGGVHSSLTVFSPELTVFLGYSNLQLLSDLTDWFDCADSWTYHTKNSGTDPIKGVWLNLLGATTPDLIRSALPQDAIGGGLTSRIIFVYEEKKEKTVPFPFLSQEDKILHTRLQATLELIYQMKGPFRVSKDFLEKWGDWYLKNDGKSPFGPVPCRVLDGYIERRPTQLLKLSMIMSASRGRDMIITAGDFEAALSLLKRTEVKMPQALGGVGAGQFSDLTYRVIEKLREKPATLEELVRTFLYDGGSEALGVVMQTLLTARMVQMTFLEDGHQAFELSNKGQKLPLLETTDEL